MQKNSNLAHEQRFLALFNANMGALARLLGSYIRAPAAYSLRTVAEDVREGYSVQDMTL